MKWDLENLVPKLPYNQEPEELYVSSSLYNYINLLTLDGGPTEDIDNKVERAADMIFKKYPIWDESMRKVINERILHHYLWRNFAYETPGRWQHEINDALFEIMPYYNQLAPTQDWLNRDNVTKLKDITDYGEQSVEDKDNYGDNKLNTQRDIDSDYTLLIDNKAETDTILHDDNNNTTTVDQDTTNNSIHKFWDTPQTDLNLLDAAHKSYATTIDTTSETGTLDSTTHSHTVDDATENEKSKSLTDRKDNTQRTEKEGTTFDWRDNTDTDRKLNSLKDKTGNFGIPTQRLVKEYRDIIINIVEMIVEDPKIQTCFSFILA